MKTLKAVFRKYHILFGLIFVVPLLITVITGMLAAIFDEWFHNDELAEFMLDIHTMKIIGLEKIYPIILGIGLLIIIATAIGMYFKKR